MLWIVILRHIVLRGWVVVFAIPFEEFWQWFWRIRIFDCKLDGIVNFLARADAFKWLGRVWIGKAIEDLS